MYVSASLQSMSYQHLTCIPTHLSHTNFFSLGMSKTWNVIATVGTLMCIAFSLGLNLKHGISLSILVYICLRLFLLNLCVLNSNLSDIILYLVTFTFILAKHKKGRQNVRKSPYFLWFIAHVSRDLHLIKQILVSLKRNDLHFTFKSKTSAYFIILTVTIIISLNMLAIIWLICSNLVY